MMSLFKMPANFTRFSGSKVYKRIFPTMPKKLDDNHAQKETTATSPLPCPIPAQLAQNATGSLTSNSTPNGEEQKIHLNVTYTYMPVGGWGNRK